MASTADVRKGRKSHDFRTRREHFDTAWQGTRTPQIEAFLPLPDTAAVYGYSRRELLLELVEIDLESRWKAGFPRSHFDSTDDSFPSKPRIEDYLARFPELGSAEELPVDLVVQEYKARCEAGEAVEHAEYVDRFPALADSLLAALRDADTNMTEPTARFVRCPQCHSSIAVPELTAAAKEFVPCQCGFNVPIIDARSGDQREGEIVGNYQLIRWLGRGSFANVWVAFDLRLERNVALKIPYTRRKGEERPNLIVNEARIVAGLNHPNIVKVHDLGQGDDAFIASEYIKGQNLETSLRLSPRSPENTAVLCRKMADALHYLHGKGIVHRDIKPSNILLDEHDEPHLTDFGLAKRESESIALSSAGELIGTVAYMSPEQAAGKGNRADGRSDIFSLGIVMYEMLAGTLPFHGDRLTIMNKIQKEDPQSILKHKPKTPRDLETICFRCLEKEPGKRFATAAELADELGRFLRGEPILTRPATRFERLVKWAKRHPARAIAAATSTAAAAAIVVALGLGLLRYAERIESIQELAKKAANEEALILAAIENVETIDAIELIESDIEVYHDKLRDLQEKAPDKNWFENGQGQNFVVLLRQKLIAAETAIKIVYDLEKRSGDIMEAISKAHENYRHAMALIGSALFAGQPTQAESPSAAPWRPTIGDSKYSERIAEELGKAVPLNRVDELATIEPLVSEEAPTGTDVLPSDLPAHGLGKLRFPVNEREALSEMQVKAHAALAALGINLARAKQLSPDSDELIWNQMDKANATADTMPKRQFSRLDPKQIKPLKEMACELILLHANATFQLNKNDAGRALEQLTVAARVGLVRESNSPPAANTAGQSPKSRPQIPEYTYRRLKQEFAGAAGAVGTVTPATFEPSPEDNPTWFDHFFAGCRAMPANALDDRQELYKVPLGHFEKSYKKDPDRIWTGFFLAICQIRNGESVAAEKLLTPHIKHNEGFPFAHILRGIACGEVYRSDPLGKEAKFDEAIGEFAEAAKAIARIDDRIPLDMAFRLRFAVSMSRATLQFDAARVDPGQRELRLENAAADFQEAARLARDERDADRQNLAEGQLALVLWEQGETGAALTTIDAVLDRVAPDDAGIRASLLMPRAEIRLNAGNKAGAAEDFRAAAELLEMIASPATHAQWASAQVNYAWTAGIAQTNRDHRPAAMDACQKVIQLAGKPEYRQSKALKNRATAAHLILAILRSKEARDRALDAKRFDEAGKELDERRKAALAARDRALDAKRFAGAKEEVDEQKKSALAARASQRLAALESLDAYLSDRTDDAAAFEMRGNLRMKQYLAGAAEDYGRAAYLYQQAGLNKDELRTRRMQALCLATWGAPEAAVKAFDRAIDVLGNDTIDMRLCRGFALVAAGEFDRAFEDAEHVAKHSDEPFDLYRAAGIYALAAGHSRVAKDDVIGKTFGPRADRSLELLRKALEDSVDKDGNFLHPKAETIVAFPQSDTFWALRDRKGFSLLLRDFVRPVQIKAEKNATRIVPIRNEGGGK